MEKQGKSRSNCFKFLPKAAPLMNFHNPPFSPTNKLKGTHAGKGFSGPLTSIIPAEARGKPKNSSFDALEPTSPKISCMGQVKLKNKKAAAAIKKEKKKNVSLPKDFKPKTPAVCDRSGGAKAGQQPGRKSEGCAPTALPEIIGPSLSQMKRFSSCRDSLPGFDWTSTAQIAPVEDGDHQNRCSDEESEGEEGEVVIVPLQPKEEINLWKRRTMAQPTPLQL